MSDDLLDFGGFPLYDDDEGETAVCGEGGVFASWARTEIDRNSEGNNISDSFLSPPLTFPDSSNAAVSTALEGKKMQQSFVRSDVMAAMEKPPNAHEIPVDIPEVTTDTYNQSSTGINKEPGNLQQDDNTLIQAHPSNSPPKEPLLHLSPSSEPMVPNPASAVCPLLQPSIVVPHRGALRRLRVPVQLTSTSASLLRSTTSQSVPFDIVYAITIVVDVDDDEEEQSTTEGGDEIESDLQFFSSFGFDEDDTTIMGGQPSNIDLRPNSSAPPNQRHRKRNPQRKRNALIRHDLRFTRAEFDYYSRLFSILDCESRGSVNGHTVKDFVELRCPVFRRRDVELKKLGLEGRRRSSVTSTFDEMWRAVSSCSAIPASNTLSTPTTSSSIVVQFGIEAWMVFCRLISLAQCQEAKRRFSARHSQQTMRHRSGGRGSEVVFVDVPPPDPPALLTPRSLVEHEQYQQQQQQMRHRVNLYDFDGQDDQDFMSVASAPLGLPELDLDHALVSSREYDLTSANEPSCVPNSHGGSVSVSVFGSAATFVSTSAPKHHSASSSSTAIGGSSKFTQTPSSASEFVIHFTRDIADTHRHPDLSPPFGTQSSPSTGISCDTSSIVRRTLNDMEWLHKTFIHHKLPGGTLCGRIIPPFPSSTLSSSFSNSKRAHTKFEGDPGIGKTHTSGGKAVAAAAAGVGIIASVAKSILLPSSSNLVSRSSSPTIANTAGKGGSGNNFSNGGTISSDIDPSFDGSYRVARHLEKYLNYLLENRSMATSFPLNAILKSSQSGLDSAKRLLEEQSRMRMLQRRQKRADANTNAARGTIVPKSSEKASSWFLSSEPARAHSGATPSQHQKWVRTAAQAAMALKLHGILETTGMPSVSARIQHASLPQFDSSGRKFSAWDDDVLSEDHRTAMEYKNSNHSEIFCDDEGEFDSFERGVVKVESELDVDFEVADDSAGYDLLPSPVPLSERSALCAGSAPEERLSLEPTAESPFRTENSSYSRRLGNDAREKTAKGSGQPTFRYGLPQYSPENYGVVLGDLSVDKDIDKLHDIIRSVDSTLGRCLAACLAIGEAHRQEYSLHLRILWGLDSWEGMRGEFITQRALLHGVTALEHGSGAAQHCLSKLNEDLSWHAALASSAVTAAEEVRSAVQASRTAAGAKIAADSALATATKHASDLSKSSTPEETRTARARHSIAQSHAIHAAVIEHEAHSAKRRAAMALAHDVKCWNVHRKRELLRTCREVVERQRDACRRSADAWEHMLNGLLGPNLVVTMTEDNGDLQVDQNDNITEPAASSTFVLPYISPNYFGGSAQNNNPAEDLMGGVGLADGGQIDPKQQNGEITPNTASPSFGEEYSTEQTPPISEDFAQGLGENAVNENEIVVEKRTQSKKETFDDVSEVPMGAEVLPMRDEGLFCEANEENSVQNETKQSAQTPELLPADAFAEPSQDTGEGLTVTQGIDITGSVEREEDAKEGQNMMTESMESLADGLMTWGGQYESDDDGLGGMDVGTLFE